MSKLYFVLETATVIIVWIKWGWMWGLLAIPFAPIFWVYYLVKLALDSGLF